MADIRTLTVEGTTYNIKDATARADITTLRTNVTKLQQNTADLPQIRENIETNANDISSIKNTIAKNQIYDTASGSIASFPDGADDEPIKQLIVNIDPVQAGSGDPSPDNVRPISGWTGSTVTRAGANLLPNFTSIPSQSGLTFDVNENGTVTINGTATATVSVNAPWGTFIWDGVLDAWLSGSPSGGDYQNSYSLRISGKINGYSSPDIGNGVKLENFSQTYPITNRQLAFTIVIREGTVCNNLVFAPMLNVGLSAQPYEPYAGNTYDFTFPSEAGTVYGGTLDATTGVLTVTKAYALLNDADKWENAVGTITLRYQTFLNNRKYFSTSYEGCICTYLPVVNKSDNFARWTGASTNQFGLYSTTLTLEQVKADATAGKIAICYDIATPIEYTLTAQQINTLLGQNNIWADTGDASVTYPADLKLYIDKKVAQ